MAASGVTPDVNTNGFASSNKVAKHCCGWRWGSAS